MSIFKSSKKSPLEMTRCLKDAVYAIANDDYRKFHNEAKAHDEMNKQILNIKNILFSQADQDPPNEAVSTLGRELMDHELLATIINNMPKLLYDTKKGVVLIFCNLLRKQLSPKTFVDFLLEDNTVISAIMKTYSDNDTSVSIGMMLRECAKYYKICEKILYSSFFPKLFLYMNDNSFDIGSDSYLTFKELLTRHKELVATFLVSNFDTFFGSFNNLLFSHNYVTKRQSIKFLGEILVERNNHKALEMYVSSVENLKLIMTLMRDLSSSVQFEAFHVFKIFVVNPNRSDAITDTLVKNQERLVEYLTNFQNDRKDDEQFIDERNYIAKQIKELVDPYC